MVSGLIDEGSGEYDSFAFQSLLEDLAIRLSFDASRDHFTGSLTTLTQNRDTAFRLLRLALTAPRFDEEPVERIRAQILTGLKSRSEDPQTLAGWEWFKTVFPGHPYGRRTEGTEDSVKAIETADLRAFAATRFAKDNLMVGVSGDITPEELGPLLDQAFGVLPEKADIPEIPEAVMAATGETLVVDKDIPQSVAMFGHKGVKRDDPDWYAAYTLNYILGGGGFNSRLMEEVREKRGLAYSVYSYLYPFEKAGTWIGGVATENARINQSLDLIKAEWTRLATEGPTEKELADAKTYLTGAWPLRLNGTAKIAGILTAMQIHGLGLDYLGKRNGFIENLTLEDLKRVAGAILDPEALNVVVVGRPNPPATEK